MGVAKYLWVSKRCPKSKFQIRIIVFDEHELIVKRLGLGTGIGDWGMEIESTPTPSPRR